MGKLPSYLGDVKPDSESAALAPKAAPAIAILAPDSLGFLRFAGP